MARLGIAIGSGGIGGIGSDAGESRARIDKCVAAMVELSEIGYEVEHISGD